MHKRDDFIVKALQNFEYYLLEPEKKIGWDFERNRHTDAFQKAVDEIRFALNHVAGVLNNALDVTNKPFSYRLGMYFPLETLDILSLVFKGVLVESEFYEGNENYSTRTKTKQDGNLQKVLPIIQKYMMQRMLML